MAKFNNKYRIESNRWQNWNYSNIGSYFITICINKREMVLGDVSDGKMILSKLGNIVKSEILKIPTYYDGVFVNEWVVMPNHIHLIVELNPMGDVGHVETIHELSLQQQQQQPNENLTNEQYRKQRRQMTISKIIGKFKMQTSKQMNTMNSTMGYKNWQANYHDHVIRDEKEYYRIKQYIINNPQNWEKDKFYK